MLVFLGLPLAIYLIFVVSPLLQAIGYSFTNWSGFNSNQSFVGLDNYVRLADDGCSSPPCGTTSSWRWYCRCW